MGYTLNMDDSILAEKELGASLDKPLSNAPLARVDQLTWEAKARVSEEEGSEAERFMNTSEPRTRQIARYTAIGMKPIEIAELMETTPDAVRIVKRSPLFQAVVKELEQGMDEKVVQARKILIDAAPKAAQTKVDLMSHPDPQIQQTASSDILKGTGVIGQDDSNGDGKGSTFIIKAEQAQFITQVLNEIKDAEKI